MTVIETTPQHDSLSDVPWPTSSERIRVPDTSMLPGSEKSPPAAVGLLKQAVQGAHNTLDRLAEGAEPAVRQLGHSVSAAAGAVQAKTDQLRHLRHEWVDSARSTVRDNPLLAIAAALAVGAVIARITHTRSRHDPR